MTGRPASSGWRSTSTAAMNWSRSTWSTQLVARAAPSVMSPLCPRPPTAQRLTGSGAADALAPLEGVGLVRLDVGPLGCPGGRGRRRVGVDPGGVEHRVADLVALVVVGRG